MATGGDEQIGYSLVKFGTVTPKNADESPHYISIVVCQDEIVLLDIDADKVQIHRFHDGNFLATSDTLEPIPRDMCLMDAMTICVLHGDGLLEMMSIESADVSRVIKRTRSLRIQGVFNRYHGVVRYKDSLVITGAKQGTMYWCIVSLLDGHVDKIHHICKGDEWSRVTTKDNIIYILCHAGLKFPDTGVYGFDILNPSQCKYKYKHQRLQWPTSIVINEDGDIFVCNGFLDDCIHRLTDSCQLLAIFTQGIPRYPRAIFWDNGRLYVTSWGSIDITVFQPVFTRSHQASDILVIDERRHSVIEETAIQIGQGNVDQAQSSVATEMPSSLLVPEESEDDKQGNDSTIPVEILRMDTESLKLYKKALQDGKEKVYNIRVMVVGPFGVGKTTLTKRLIGQQVDISERKSTEGIDVYKHCCKISLDTGQWTVQYADTEQEYRLQRLAKVLLEKQSVSDGFAHEEVVIPSQGEITSDGNADVTYEEEQVMSPPQDERSPDNKLSVTYKEQVKVDPGNEMLIPGSNANLTADLQVDILPQEEINPDSNTNVADKEQGSMDPMREMLISDTNANVADTIQIIIPPQGKITPDSNAYVADKEQIKDPMTEMLKLLQESTDQLKHDKGKVSPLSVWDFAGQYAFYTTHQTFLTRRAIYLLVSDVSREVTDLVADECFFDSEGITKCRGHELTDVWLNSIHSCAPSSEAGIPPVILVGTHVDKVNQICDDKHHTPVGLADHNFPEILIALYDYTRDQLEELSFLMGDQFLLIDKSLESVGWLHVKNTLGEVGLVPLSFVQRCADKYSTSGLKDHNNPETLIAMCDYTRSEPGELSILEGDQLILIDKSLEGFGWWKVRNTLGEVGLVPACYVQSYRYELCAKYFREIRSYLRDKPTRLHLVDEDFAIDNTILDRKLEDLKRKIVEVAFHQPYWGEEIPARWLPLEQELMKLKDVGIKVIPLTLLEDLNKAGAVQIAADELDLFLRFLHDIGTILYFSLEVLKEHIVLDPQWMINALKSLITAEVFVLKSALAIADKWHEFKQKGKLYPELIDAVWSKKNNPDFHDNKKHILLLMEQLNIIAKPRYYSEDGSEIKVESYYLAPCMLKERTPTELISLAQHPERNSSSVLCYVFRGKFLPAPIFHRLLATCVGHWPIAKKMSENLIFCGCCVFNIDLHHRLTILFRDYVIFAQVTRMGATEKNPSSKLCTGVQKFITMTLSSIISYLGQSLRFDLFIQCPRMDGYRVDCLIPVEDLKGNEDVPCHFHEISHVIMSQDVINFWFQETEQSADGCKKQGAVQPTEEVGGHPAPEDLGDNDRKQHFTTETSTKTEQEAETKNNVDQIYSQASDLTATEDHELTLPPGRKYHAFFSYASPDIQWVKDTVKRLENNHGFVCCEYDRDNTPGTSLLKFVDDSIRNAYKTVVVMTKEAFKSGFVQHEIQMALLQGFDEGRNCVVPILLQDCNVPDHLRVLNYVDARNPSQRGIWWPKLLSELQTQGTLSGTGADGVIEDKYIEVKTKHNQLCVKLDELATKDSLRRMKRMARTYLDRITLEKVESMDDLLSALEDTGKIGVGNYDILIKIMTGASVGIGIDEIHKTAKEIKDIMESSIHSQE